MVLHAVARRRMEVNLNTRNQANNTDDWDRLFQELRAYYRHSAVGRRTTGIIHHFNTPLQAILMQSELMVRKLQEEENTFAPRLSPELKAEWQKFFDYRRKKNRQLQEELAQLQRLVHLIRYQSFHEDDQGVQNIDLNELVREELAAYQTEWFFKYRVEKHLQWRDRLPPISGFYIDFSQSFRNIVDNALEALSSVDKPSLTIETRLDANRRIIAVGDNGPGLAPEIRDILFTPFVTTKGNPEKPRAGLGLFMAQRLLSPYGGVITVKSRPGETWFLLSLP